MSEKYEDLIENIENDGTFDMTRSELVGARVALQWLDQNRDQVPGRTITESELSGVAGRLYLSCSSSFQWEESASPHLQHLLGFCYFVLFFR